MTKEQLIEFETDIADCCLKSVKPFVDVCKANCKG